METELYSLINHHPSIQPLNKPSLNDGYLNGTYCSSYNYLVRTQGLSIWGQPGGRPTRTKLDGAIKEQMKIGREGLKPEVIEKLFPSTNKKFNTRLREMWKRPDAEKKAWLRAVLAAREGGKQYSDYKIPLTNESDEIDDEAEDTADDDDDRGENEEMNTEEEHGDDQSTASVDEQESGDEAEEAHISQAERDDKMNSEEEYDEDQSTATTASVDEQDSGDEAEEAHISQVERPVISNDVNAAAPTFDDDTHAIFLISFGEEAAESTLVVSGHIFLLRIQCVAHILTCMLF